MLNKNKYIFGTALVLTFVVLTAFQEVDNKQRYVKFKHVSISGLIHHYERYDRTSVCVNGRLVNIMPQAQLAVLISVLYKDSRYAYPEIISLHLEEKVDQFTSSELSKKLLPQLNEKFVTVCGLFGLIYDPLHGVSGYKLNVLQIYAVEDAAVH